MYQYILVQITLTLHFQSGTTILATPTRLLPAHVRCFAGSLLPIKSLIDCQASQARLTTPKLPQPCVNLIDIAATPSIRCSCVSTAHRETCTPILAVLVRDCWSSVTIQKAGHQGDSANHVLGIGHVEARCWGWFVQLDHPSIFHGPFDGQRKLLEGAEENQVVPEIVWACFVTAGLWQSSALWAQVAAEEELGQCSPTIFQVNSMVILPNAVRVWGNNQHSILSEAHEHGLCVVTHLPIFPDRNK